MGVFRYSQRSAPFVPLAVCITLVYVCTHNTHTHTHTHTHTPAQLITQPPESTTAALGTNATFTCAGNGQVRWQVTGTQVLTQELVELFAADGVYVPLPTPNFSELIITASVKYNVTGQGAVVCQVDPGIGVGQVEESDPVRLLVYGE